MLYACRYAWPICVLLGSMVCWAVSNPCRCQPMASQNPSRGHLEPANGSRGRYVWIMISFLGACWIVTGHMLGPLWGQIRPFGNNLRALLGFFKFCWAQHWNNIGHSSKPGKSHDAVICIWTCWNYATKFGHFKAFLMICWADQIFADSSWGPPWATWRPP